MTFRSPITRAFVQHALLVGGAFTLFLGWLYAGPVIEHSFLAESDLYEYFLPVFLAPSTIWSSYEFGGVPAFADPLDMAFYPLRMLFAAVGSWTALVVSAFVLAACSVYAYVFSLTRSRLAAGFAGVAFALSEAMMERLAHLTTLHATAWLALVLLSVDRLRGPNPLRWVAIGAFAIGNCILGGHPQLVVYGVYVGGLYALTGGIAERAGWRYYVRLIAMAGIGAILTAIKTFPVAETSLLTARQDLNFASFVSHSNTPAQMLSILFPAIVHEGREAPTYVGLATLVLAAAAAWRPFRSWRVAFWLGVIVVSLMLGAGDSTPLAQLAYHLPLYDRFRVEARHLVFAALGLSILAGFGLAAIQRGEMPHRVVYGGLALVSATVASAAAALALWPAAFELDDERSLPWSLPLWSGAIWIQLALGAATALLVVGFVRRPRSRMWTTALMLVLTSDLVLALPYGIRLRGLDETTIPASAIQPSVHARALAAQLAPKHQRLLAPAGTQLDDVVPAAFARVWKMPTAGGYGPMLLARYSELAMMGTNGSVDPLVMADDNAALDLLAVRYVVINEDDLAPAPRFERGGVQWSSRALDLPVGRPECGQRYPRTVSYALPANVQAAGIAIVARLRCSEDVPQNTEVARLRVVGEDGATYERPLLAGVDVAETGLRDAGLQRRAKHKPARVFDPDDASLSYVARFDFPAPIRAARLEVQVTTAGWLEINHLSVLDPDGAAMPLEMPAAVLNGNRWREATRFSTSRVSNRVSDEDAEGEHVYVVFENLRALPMAWMAKEIMRLPDADISTAVHHSILPDGRRFDATTMALVDATGPSSSVYRTGASAVSVRTVRDESVAVDVDSADGGFLVLSQSFYPGWRARIDDQILPVYRTDMSLQGVQVPAGLHTVEFELASSTRRAGAITSMLGLIALGFVTWRGFKASDA